METKAVLEKFRNGEISIEEAEAWFSKQPFEEMGYAKLDMHRETRSGFPEVIYCAGKPDDFLAGIYKKMLESNGEVFGTRASQQQYELVRAAIPDISYDPVSRILKKEKEGKERSGRIAVCCAGTADIPVAEEAAAPAPAAADDKVRPANWIAVKSPMVGTFYAAPAPDADPFVTVDEEVTAGQSLCIVEAMKLMNEITAEEMGTVREVCLEDATPVEYGTVLFYIEPHASEGAE